MLIVDLYDYGPYIPFSANLQAQMEEKSGNTSATFLVLQGIGEYDYVPLT